MRRRITKAEARAFQKRWVAINAAEMRELRKTPMTRKLQQLRALMAWGRHFGWTEPPEDGVAEVRRRWSRLIRAYRKKTGRLVLETSSRIRHCTFIPNNPAQ